MTSASAPQTLFFTTRWTQILQAKEDSAQGRKALADLCAQYYEPVVTFLRIELRDADAAREVSHAFFAETLAGGTIAGAKREQGRFRSYLLGAVKNFLSRYREAALRLKRGGGVLPMSLDENEEAAQAIADTRQIPTDVAFDRQWAVTLIARALALVRQECEADGKAEFFDHVKPWLTGSARHGEQAAVAELCGMTPAALKMAISRLKHRFRDAVRAEIAETLGEPAMVDEEMHVLFRALAG